MGGQHERQERIAEFVRYFEDSPKPLWLSEIQTHFFKWGLTENKIKEYVFYLIHIGKVEEILVYDPVYNEDGTISRPAWPHPDGISWRNHREYKFVREGT